MFTSFRSDYAPTGLPVGAFFVGGQEQRRGVLLAGNTRKRKWGNAWAGYAGWRRSPAQSTGTGVAMEHRDWSRFPKTSRTAALWFSKPQSSR